MGVLFFSDGLASPALSQLRVEFDYPTYDRVSARDLSQPGEL